MYSYTSSGKPVCLLGWSDVQCRSRRPRVRSLSVSSWVTSVTAVWTRSCSTTVSMAPAKRVEATVDLVSGHIPEAYKSKAMPSLGRSWSVHSLIHLLPQYGTCKTCGGHCWSRLWPRTWGLQEQGHAKPRKVMISPQLYPPAASLPPEAEEQQAHHQVVWGVVQGGHWDPRRRLPLHCPGHPAHWCLRQRVSGGHHSVIGPILHGHADHHQGIPQQQAMRDVVDVLKRQVFKQWGCEMAGPLKLCGHELSKLWILEGLI